jgi:hypothetical protein
MDQLPGQMSIMDVIVEPVRKVVRWEECREISIFDHKCDMLPRGMRFYKFRILSTSAERERFSERGVYEREVVCPYCGKHVIYEFTNVLFTMGRVG